MATRKTTTAKKEGDKSSPAKPLRISSDSVKEKPAPPVKEEVKVVPPPEIPAKLEAPPPPSVKNELDADYLRGYEYNKEYANPYFKVPNAKYVPPPPGSYAEKTKAALLLQPRVRMMVPRQFKEDPSILQSVNLNGYRLDFPKNTYVELPEEIANILRESLQQSEIALNHPTRLDGSEKALN